MKHLFYPSGKLYAEISEKKKIYFYEDGTLKTSLNYLDGKLEGEALLFYPDGSLKRRCYFEKGIRQGLDQMWEEDGSFADEGRYDRGTPVGIHRRFSKGKLIEEIEYLDAKRFNLREWDEKGEIHLEAIWNEFDYKERVWDRFENIWVVKEGFWNGQKLVYT